MITNLDPASELFLANLGRTQQRLADANRLVSSGKRISTAADAPDEIDALLQLRADRQRNTQIQANLTQAKAEADAADNALSAAVKVMDRALVLGSQGANGTLDAAGRQSLSLEVEALLQQMVAYSQTAVQGRYIFSGDLDQSPSYALDVTAPNGVVQLTAAAATRRIEDPAGGSFAASKTAQEIFDTHNPDGTFAGDNVFGALNGLRLALQGNDMAAIGSSVAAIKSASDHINAMQAFYGTVQNRIQDANKFASQYDTQLQTEISQKEDADVVSAALELTQASTQLQAAFQMRAKLPRTSLFDFLG